MTGEDLAQIAAAARNSGALVAVDVLHPGRPQDLDRLAPLLVVTDWFIPNGDQILALTGRTELTDAMKDVLALGTAAVAVTCGADGCLVAGPDSAAPQALPALEVEVTDTTGCGDGFTAGLLAGLLAGPRHSTPPGSASPAAPWSPPAWARTPGSGASPRCWTSSAARSRPWPAGLRSTSHE
jgi:sugar/nucleoside kinase (ribokinase family)